MPPKGNWAGLICHTHQHHRHQWLSLCDRQTDRLSEWQTDLLMLLQGCAVQAMRLTVEITSLTPIRLLCVGGKFNLWLSVHAVHYVRSVNYYRTFFSVADIWRLCIRWGRGLWRALCWRWSSSSGWHRLSSRYRASSTPTLTPSTTAKVRESSAFSTGPTEITASSTFGASLSLSVLVYLNCGLICCNIRIIY